MSIGRNTGAPGVLESAFGLTEMSGQIEPNYLSMSATFLELSIILPRIWRGKGRLHGWVLLRFLSEDRSMRPGRLGESSLKRESSVFQLRHPPSALG